MASYDLRFDRRRPVPALVRGHHGQDRSTNLPRTVAMITASTASPPTILGDVPADALDAQATTHVLGSATTTVASDASVPFH